MEGTNTRQLGVVNFEVEAAGGLMRRHADQLLKIPLRFAEGRILDVQADITTHNPGIPVFLKFLKKLWNWMAHIWKMPQWLLWRLEGPRHPQFVYRIAYADHQSS